MNIIGLNKGHTQKGKKLKDGGTCLVRDNTILTVILEERISRVKQDGGYDQSLPKVLQFHNFEPLDIDAISYSTCCETSNSPFSLNLIKEGAVPYIPVNHHFAHAYSVFSICPFEEAIIVVLDAGGNVLDDGGEEWWKCRREQHSYYTGTSGGIVPMGADFSLPFESGFAEVYRAFTHYLGWNSSQYAGKVMALSAFGDLTRFEGKHLFYWEGECLRSVMNNDPLKPLTMVETTLRQLKITDIPPRKKDTEILQCHKDLACWLQAEVEIAFFKKIDILCKKTGIKNVCLAGGVGYNCKMNGKALQHPAINHFFVGPASGDQGQCVGSALFAVHALTDKFEKVREFTPYLGVEYDKAHLEEKLAGAGLTILNSEDVMSDVAMLLSSGKVVAWYHGRSEFGPRALGARSLLADPRRARIKYALNCLKQREHFMPFAPSVLDEYADDYFLLADDCSYMTHAIDVKAPVRKIIPAVVHADGTSRIHRIRKSENSAYHCMVEKFKEITGVPMVLNTSFNRSGEPIVESHGDAINSFLGLGIGYMFIDGFLVENKLAKNTDLCSDTFAGLTIVPDDKDAKAKIINVLGDNITFIRRDKFNLNREFVNWLHYGKKTTTIRYKRNMIEIPRRFNIPMYSTPNFEMNMQSNERVGTAEILKYSIKKYRELTDFDAINDGFTDVSELRGTLETIYGHIPAEEFVTIYTIYLNPS